MRSSPNYVEIQNLQKAYRHADLVLCDISMTVAKGEFVCLFGPNGCGKTSFLRILTGMDEEWEGIVRIDGKAPEKADVGIVPQDSNMALLPWRTVIDNICLPLELNGSSRRKTQQVVRDFCERADIDLPMNLYPYQLSGGQRQLTVIVRALIGQPDLLVLDEPFASLDFAHMTLVEEALLRLWQFTETTTFLVTHDLLSSVYLADRIFLLSARPATVIHTQEICLQRPRSRQNPALISLLNELQQIFLTSGRSK